MYDTTQDHFINVSAGCTPDWPVQIRVEVGVFMVLCQYFSELGHMWRTDGMMPLPETSAGQAVCSTRHLTVFGASLLVPQHAISFTVHVSDPESKWHMNINDCLMNIYIITSTTECEVISLEKNENNCNC